MAPEKRERWIEFILAFLISMILIQIVLGIILYIFPNFGYIMAIFTNRSIGDTLLYTVDPEGFKRLTGIIIRQESMGEAIVTLLPIVLYKFAKTEKPIYFFVLMLFGCGVIMSATRSAIILFCLFSIIYMFQQRKLFKIPQWFFLSFICTLATILIIGFFPSTFENVINRFSLAFQMYQKGEPIIGVMNRDEVWSIAFHATISNLNLFGNGMISLVGSKMKTDFHNLYLTILYQMGILGFIVFWGFIAMLILRTYKSFKIALNDKDRLIAYSVLMSLSILIINSVKFEFNRDASYQQYVWVLFAIYYLIGEYTDRKFTQPE